MAFRFTALICLPTLVSSPFLPILLLPFTVHARRPSALVAVQLQQQRLATASGHPFPPDSPPPFFHRSRESAICSRRRPTPATCDSFRPSTGAGRRFQKRLFGVFSRVCAGAVSYLAGDRLRRRRRPDAPILPEIGVASLLSRLFGLPPIFATAPPPLGQPGQNDMDLETENYLASLLMEEARRLRLQAETEGVHAYLRQPNIRGRPNSRFLTATVLGVQQANRAIEVTEMWRAREKELELESRCKDSSSKYGYKRGRKEKHLTDSRHRDSCSRLERENARLADMGHDYISRREKERTNNALSYSSSKRDSEGCCSFKDDGFRDDEVEEFLRSRVKRGRGDIGSRMDEAGPDLSQRSCSQEDNSLSDVRVKEEWERRILGPEKPSFLKPHRADSDSDAAISFRGTSSSRKYSSRKRGLEEGKAKKKEKKSKHRHKSRSKKD